MDLTYVILILLVHQSKRRRSIIVFSPYPSPDKGRPLRLPGGHRHPRPGRAARGARAGPEALRLGLGPQDVPGGQGEKVF